MKVVLINCPQTNPEKPPLSLAYLASYLSQRNIEITCFDLNIEFYDECDAERKKFWDAVMSLEWYDLARYNSREMVSNELIRKWAEAVCFSNPDVVGLSLNSTNLFTSLRLAKEIKKMNSDKIIVLGGPEAYRQVGLSNLEIFVDADALVCGEGEEKFYTLLNSIQKYKKIFPGKGILVRANGIWEGDPSIGLNADINALPFPDYSFFSLKKYKRREEFPLLFSRGCCNRCVFCFERAYWNEFRCRNVENVIEEIAQVQKKYGIRHFALNDSLVNGDMDFLSEFCKRVISEKLDIEWWGMARVHPGMSYSFVKTMAQAGCKLIAYGIESGSQKVLNASRKGYAVATIEEVLCNTHRAGVLQGINLMIGLPAEGEDEFRETCEFIKANGSYIYYVNISILGIEPFTDLYGQRAMHRDAGLLRQRAKKLSEVVNRYVGFCFDHSDS